MPQYELSIDPAFVAEAERLITLDGRAFPTIAVSWESQMLGQTWTTTLVLDYTVPLPPLKHGSTFNEVRVAAYTGDVQSKFFYFGTELTADAPRIGPEMENLIGPQQAYQEYRLNADVCPVSYLDLIATTPRVYGNGPQDYYSPPLKVERFDAAPGEGLIADNFPAVVANLEVVPGDQLTDPSVGFWHGSRFVGTKKIAILRQGRVVGLYRRTGRAEREVVPPDVVRRNPHEDVHDAWVAIDLGTRSTVVVIGDGTKNEMVRIGSSDPARLSRDFESPTEISFQNLQRVTKAWSDRVILPLTEWGDVYVGHGSAQRRDVQGKERALRTKCSIEELTRLPNRLGKGKESYVCGRADLDSPLPLEEAAPPIIDEEGIAPDDPFDPLELYAYYIGLHVNNHQRGLHLRYVVGMPTGWDEDRRTRTLAALRRGIVRSLPAGMVAYDDLEQLQVVDGGNNVLAFAAFAFRVFGIAPRPNEPVPFVSIDAGASETSVLCGQVRVATPDEVGAGLEKVIEHVKPAVLPEVAGEHLLHQLAYKVYAQSGSSMRTNDIPFDPPDGEALIDGAESRLVPSIEGQANVRLIKEAVRPILEDPIPRALPDVLQLFGADGRVRDARVMIDRAVLNEWLRGQLSAAAVRIKTAIATAFEEITRDVPPYAELRVLMGGRLGMHPFLQERLGAVLPQGVRIHKFREPDDTNVAAPTVKLSAALGLIAMAYQPMAPSEVADERANFDWVVGRGKRGKLLVVLDGTSGYDVWRELGACTRPDVSVLYAPASAGSELAADDPAIRKVVCSLGYDAVGYRVYVRCVTGTRVEVSVGPPGGRPDEDAVSWAIDLAAGTAEALPG